MKAKIKITCTKEQETAIRHLLSNVKDDCYCIGYCKDCPMLESDCTNIDDNKVEFIIN